jgi:hypothetical protein
MDQLRRPAAYVLLPLSVLIILESLRIFSLDVPYIRDKVLAVSLIIFLFHGINLAMIAMQKSSGSAIEIATNIVFVLPALLYILDKYANISLIPNVPLILGVIMLVDSLYQLRH